MPGITLLTGIEQLLMKTTGYLVFIGGLLSIISIICFFILIFDISDLDPADITSRNQVLEVLRNTFLWTIGINILLICVGLASDPKYVFESNPWSFGIILSAINIIILILPLIAALILPHPP